jgi:phosphatidylserine/phosphatidylglycerophosphate/cardiolipin synthase-like enzyme
MRRPKTSNMWTWSSLIPQKGKSTFAAYVLTDWPVMQALARAADRGVKIRIYLDSTQLAEHEQTKVFQDLAQTPGVEIRTKHNRAPPEAKTGDSVRASGQAIAKPGRPAGKRRETPQKTRKLPSGSL